MGEPGEAPGWLLEEQTHAGRENVDADHVASYDSKEDADAANEVALCRGLGLVAESVIVDLGAGTGQFSMCVAAECARVIAVDVSPVMLKVLRAKAEKAGTDNLEMVEAGFLTYSHEGQPADLVYSRYALHHIPDFWKALALARVRRMLGPGGVFRLWDIVYSFGPGDAEQRLEAWCDSLQPASAAPADQWTREDIEEHVRDEHSTFSWLLEPMMQRCGFAIEAAEYSDDGIFAKYVLRAV